MKLVTALIDELKRKYPGKRGQRLIIGGLIAVILGPQPKENHTLRRQDIRVRGELICAIISGVKKTPRARRDAIANLPGEDEIRAWVIGELRERLATLEMEEGSRLCDYESSSLRHCSLGTCNFIQNLH